MRRPSWFSRPAAVAATFVVVAAVTVGPASATNWATYHPPSNTDPTNMNAENPHTYNSWCDSDTNTSSGPPPVRPNAGCLRAARLDFDAARTKEHVRKIVFPSNFLKLNPAQQLLVLVDVERVDRGLRPFIGLSPTLNAIALRGAKTMHDPAFPKWARSGQDGTILATGMNPLFSEFLWMYADGYSADGSWNAECYAPNAPKCWVHRHAQLRETTGPLVMGAAATPLADWGPGTNGPSIAAIFLGDDHHDTTLSFRWSSERRYFPLGSRENP